MSGDTYDIYVVVTAKIPIGRDWVWYDYATGQRSPEAE